MKSVTERPNIWHVIVTLAAMFYLSLGTRAMTQILYPPGGNSLFQTEVVLNTAAAFLGVLIVPTWIFLLRDLFRQVVLFFPRRTK